MTDAEKDHETLNRELATLIEAVARAICLTQGEDPDALDASRYCDAGGQPMPLWNWYGEQAFAAISVVKARA